MAAIHIILACLAAHFDGDVEQMDMVTGFPEALVAEDIYLRQPEGHCQVHEHGEELCTRCRRGFLAAPRNWTQTKRVCVVGGVWLQVWYMWYMPSKHHTYFRPLQFSIPCLTYRILLILILTLPPGRGTLAPNPS